MTVMKDREGAMEKKYVLDEELRFKAHAHRNRLLGLWVADLMGKIGDDADKYAQSIVMTGLKNGHEEDLLAYISNDLKQAGVAYDEDILRARMEELMQESLMNFHTD